LKWREGGGVTVLGGEGMVEVHVQACACVLATSLTRDCAHGPDGPRNSVACKDSPFCKDTAFYIDSAYVDTTFTAPLVHWRQEQKPWRARPRDTAAFEDASSSRWMLLCRRSCASVHWCTHVNRAGTPSEVQTHVQTRACATPRSRTPAQARGLSGHNKLWEMQITSGLRESPAHLRGWPAHLWGWPAHLWPVVGCVTGAVSLVCPVRARCQHHHPAILTSVSGHLLRNEARLLMGC